jgi:hypothetical protein
MKGDIPPLPAMLLLLPTACATHGSGHVTSQPEIAVRTRQIQCALNSLSSQGFVITRDPLHPDQFEARRDNSPAPDILLVAVHLSNDSARVGAVPVSNDDRLSVSHDAQIAAQRVHAECPPRPVD